MNVLVDTSVWSIVLRRSRDTLSSDEKAIVANLRELIKEMRISIAGTIRQEILSGISDEKQFNKLRDYLKPFQDLGVISGDYERAAEFYNICREKGIQGSHIDFFICAIAERYELHIFTTDKDFLLYSKYLPISLYDTGVKGEKKEPGGGEEKNK